MLITTSMLRDSYAEYANPLDKMKREVDDGVLFRLRTGLYETDARAEPLFLAAAILAPSYVSFETALSFYGLIPERVYAITSASFLQRKNKVFENCFGRFTYTDVPVEVFPHGISILEKGEYAIKIATKEKAICDTLLKAPVVRSRKGLKHLLFENLRIDEEEFASCDFKKMRELARRYKKTNLRLLEAWVEEEYLHE